MSKRSKEAKKTLTVAVFADGQNINLVKHGAQIIQFAQQKLGQVPFLWAYHSWRQFKQPVQKQLQVDGWQCVDVALSTKNELDNCLISDCRKYCHHLLADVFVLVSGDKDFAGLVTDLIAIGKQVIVIGRRNHVSLRLQELTMVYYVEELN